jgi:flagellar motor switch protein FliG
MTPDTDNKSAASEYGRLTKFQKLAALLVMLGPDNASAVLKRFDLIEVEAISTEMAKMPMISQETQQELLREFSDVALQAGASLTAGLDVARNTLEKTVGLFKATEIMGRVSPARTPVAAMQEVVDMEARQIFNLIRGEQPQMVALVLSYVGTDKAAECLTYFHVDVRDRILERVATLAPTPIEVVETVVKVLVSKRGSNQTRALNQTGGVKTAADLLNAMDKNTGKSLLASIEERNAELGAAIRQKMFTFEDLVRLDTVALQRILREVDLRDLAIALKTASDTLRQALLGCISKRAAETVQEEIAFMGPIKLRDIEGAQMKIIESVRKLEAEGDVDLGEANSKGGRYATG